LEARYSVTSKVLQFAAERHVLEARCSVTSKLLRFAAERHILELGSLQTPRSFGMLLKDIHERPGVPSLPIILFFHLRLAVDVNIFVYIWDTEFHSECGEG
jgi:hypothetical protein